MKKVILEIAISLVITVLTEIVLNHYFRKNKKVQDDC